MNDSFGEGVNKGLTIFARLAPLLSPCSGSKSWLRSLASCCAIANVEKRRVRFLRTKMMTSARKINARPKAIHGAASKKCSFVDVAAPLSPAPAPATRLFGSLGGTAVMMLCVRESGGSSDVETNEASVVLPSAAMTDVVPVKGVAETVAEEMLLRDEAVDHAPVEVFTAIVLSLVVASVVGERVGDTATRVGVSEGDADGANDVGAVQSTELVVSSTVLDVVEFSVPVVRLVVVVAVVDAVVMVGTWAQLSFTVIRGAKVRLQLN